MCNSKNFSGQISTVLDGGQRAIVTLDKALWGQNLALITEASTGRIALMNGTGSLVSKCRVSGLAKESKNKYQSLQVLSVSKEVAVSDTEAMTPAE